MRSLTDVGQAAAELAEERERPEKFVGARPAVVDDLDGWRTGPLFK
jgi:hypothetical protein